MFPIVLDITKLSIVLIGAGPATKRRKELLTAAGCTPKEIAGEPKAEELQGADVVFTADFDVATTARIYALAKEAGALVNAEDIREYCDFHVPALVRRGDLLLTVSTAGKSPGLARRLRQTLERLFGEEWSERLDALSDARLQWKEEGADFKELGQRTNAYLDKEGWLENVGR